MDRFCNHEKFCKIETQTLRRDADYAFHRRQEAQTGKESSNPVTLWSRGEVLASMQQNRNEKSNLTVK